MCQSSIYGWHNNYFRPMNDVEKILKWIREVDIKTLRYDVVGIGWGPKKVNGVETEECGVIFTVKEKKPLEELTYFETIPKYIEVPIDDGMAVSTITDVIEPVLCQKLPTDCNTRSSVLNPVSQHRIRRRPLMGGIESMSNWGNFVGTLGIFVKDKTDGQIVALSNSHIFANSQVDASFLTPNDMGTTSTLKISGYQPTGYWRTTAQNDYIGSCKRTVMIGNIDNSIVGNSGGYPVIANTSCDAAILGLSNYTLINSLCSPNVLDFNIKAPYQFATDAEIDSLAIGGSNQGAPIFRSGRTLGAVGFPGNSYSCGLSVYQFNTALVGLYSGFVSYFSDSFYVRGNVTAGAGGDSGSAMFALFNRNSPSLSAWKLIGLLFAGPNDETYTIGCRITNIANALNIGPWDTKMPTISSKSDVLTLGGDFSQTVALSGRVYYQTGYR